MLNHEMGAYQVNGLVAAYGFERLARLTEEQFKQIFGSMFDVDPEAKACAMRCRLADVIDLPRNYRLYQAEAIECRCRDAYKAGI